MWKICWTIISESLAPRINAVTPVWAHKNSRQNLYKRLEAKFGGFATRSPKLGKCTSKKPTEQDFVSTSPNLDALRNDKEDAATVPEYILHFAKKIAIRINKNVYIKPKHVI